MKKFKFAGLEIDNLTIQEALEEITKLFQKDEKYYIVTPNASHIVLLQNDKDFKQAYSSAKLILPDGVSLVIASKILGQPLKCRCAGSDLFLDVCKLLYNLNKSIFILGGVNGSEKIAEHKLKIMFPGIKVFTYSPPFGFDNDKQETEQIINIINNTGADFLFVCVGAPKSEKWIYRNIGKLNIKIAFCVGMSLNFFSGTAKRAPKWMQKIGLEWFWRLIQEPKRLWKRYLIGNTIFAFLVLKELIKKFLGEEK